jgi:hypothetical protein
VFVVDSTDTLLSYDAAGNFLKKVSVGAPAGKLDGGGVTLAQNTVYVTVGPALAGGVRAFDAYTLQPVSLPAGAFAGLVTPVGIAFDSTHDTLWVANFQGQPSSSLIRDLNESLGSAQTIDTTKVFLPPGSFALLDNPIAITYCATSGYPPSTAARCCRSHSSATVALAEAPPRLTP